MDLRDLTTEQLDIVDSVLRDYLNLDCIKLRDLIYTERHKRRLSKKLDGQELTKKFLLKYIKFELCDGIGSYEVWKVGRMDIDDDRKQYTLYPDKLMILNTDGEYSIDTYTEEVIIETEDDLKRLTVITKEEFNSEFEKAIEYYKSLKTD
jgi:hypothetical protein